MADPLDGLGLVLDDVDAMQQLVCGNTSDSSCNSDSLHSFNEANDMLNEMSYDPNMAELGFGVMPDFGAEGAADLLHCLPVNDEDYSSAQMLNVMSEEEAAVNSLNFELGDGWDKFIHKDHGDTTVKEEPPHSPSGSSDSNSSDGVSFKPHFKAHQPPPLTSAVVAEKLECPTSPSQCVNIAEVQPGALILPSSTATSTATQPTMKVQLRQSHAPNTCKRGVCVVMPKKEADAAGLHATKVPTKASASCQSVGGSNSKTLELTYDEFHALTAQGSLRWSPPITAPTHTVTTTTSRHIVKPAAVKPTPARIIVKQESVEDSGVVAAGVRRTGVPANATSHAKVTKVVAPPASPQSSSKLRLETGVGSIQLIRGAKAEQMEAEARRQLQLSRGDGNVVLPPLSPNSKLDIDRQIKRQQRMIKNRESASLSRKRRKEYLSNLEDEAKSLACENHSLKKENEVLKRANASLKDENLKLRRKPGCATVSTAAAGQSVAMSQPSHSTGYKMRKMASTCVMMIALTVAFNIAPLGSILNQGGGVVSGPPAKLDGRRVGRTLMSVDEVAGADNTVYDVSMHGSRGVNASHQLADMKNCSMHGQFVNKTENLRLADELAGWVARHEKEKTKEHGNSLLRKPLSSKLQLQRRAAAMHQQARMHVHGKFDDELRRPQLQQNSELQLFSSDSRALGKALQRKKEHFYMLSLSLDHMLLPATERNQTENTHLTVVVPASMHYNSSQEDSKQVDLMEIDCVVVSTRLVNVDESAVPAELRHKLRNSRNKSRKTNRP